MRNHLSRSVWPLLCLPLLAACSSYAPPANLVAMDRGQVVAQMGQPETERRLDAGSRLEFPRGPYGTQTWFVYLDAAGRATRAEQVLSEAHFNRVVPGMTQEELRMLLGRPGEVRTLGRARGVVWSWRYDNSSCLWFEAEISSERQVRSAGYGEPPECEAPDDRSDR